MTASDGSTASWPRCSRRAASSGRPDEVRALVEGVAAAPDGLRAGRLARPDRAAAGRPSCATHLRRLKAEIAAERRPEPPVAERLARAARACSPSRALDGLILPLTDEHRSEYLPAAAQRLDLAHRLHRLRRPADRARASAPRSSSTAATRCRPRPSSTPRCSSAATSPSSRRRSGWPSSSEPGQRLGFDPRLHTKAEVERYRRACAKAGAELVALPGNPVDAIWTSRPPAPIAPVTLLDDAYAGEASAAKRARMARAAAPRPAPRSWC